MIAMKHVTPDSVLRVNPELVVWPGDSLIFGFGHRSGRLKSPLHIPAGGVRVLRAFVTPRRVSDVFRSLSAESLDVIGQSLNRGLLVWADGKESVGSARPSLFEGFYFADYPSALPSGTSPLT